MGVGAPVTHFDVTFSTEGTGVLFRNGLIQTFPTTGELGTERITFPVLISTAIATMENPILLIHCNLCIIAHQQRSICDDIVCINNKDGNLINLW